MKKPENVLKIFEKYTPLVDGEIKRLISGQEKYEMYDMLSYFFGYLNEDLKPEEGYGGKRFRPGITLLISDFYGTAAKALCPACAVEIFHNFTLIHDDIEDNDPIRRGRPTVWKKWGVAHAINAGDAQLVLALTEVLNDTKLSADKKAKIMSFLNEIYVKVMEGQFLDFTLAESRSPILL